jgi:hypothetical protein
VARRQFNLTSRGHGRATDGDTRRDGGLGEARMETTELGRCWAGVGPKGQ